MKKWLVILLLLSTANFLATMEVLDSADENDDELVVLENKCVIARVAFDKIYENLCMFKDECDEKDLETLYSCAFGHAKFSDLSDETYENYEESFIDEYGDVRASAAQVIRCAFLRDLKGTLFLKPVEKICRQYAEIVEPAEDPIIASDDDNDENDMSDSSAVTSSNDDEEDDSDDNDSGSQEESSNDDRTTSAEEDKDSDSDESDDDNSDEDHSMSDEGAGSRDDDDDDSDDTESSDDSDDQQEDERDMTDNNAVSNDEHDDAFYDYWERK